MSPFERVAVALAEHFGLDAVLLIRAKALRLGVEGALEFMDENKIVERILVAGPLTGASNPYGVLIARTRQLANDETQRSRLAEDRAEERRWKRVDAAARRGETLRDLVERGDLYTDEAADLLRGELADEDLRSIAIAALEGDNR